MNGPQQDGGGTLLLRERLVVDRLAAIRDMIHERVSPLGLASAELTRFVLAVNEAATNAIRHASGTGEVTVWYDGNRLVAEIRDSGPGINQRHAVHPPPVNALHGRGLWLIRQLVHHVSITNIPGGAVVRLTVYRNAHGTR